MENNKESRKTEEQKMQDELMKRAQAQEHVTMFIKNKIYSFIYTMLFTITSIIVLMILWNYVMPYLFNLPPVNIWRAGSLYILSMLMFKYK